MGMAGGFIMDTSVFSGPRSMFIMPYLLLSQPPHHLKEHVAMLK